MSDYFIAPPRYVLMGEASKENGTQLAKQLEPPKNSIFSRLKNNNSLLNDNKTIPLGRDERGYYEVDGIFMNDAQKLVQNGTINKSSFVLSNTGHDIPMFAQLLQNPDLNAQGAFNYTKNTYNGAEEGNISRTFSQAQSFGNEIERVNSQANKDKKPGAIFVGLEAHRKEPIDTKKLPTAEELKKVE